MANGISALGWLSAAGSLTQALGLFAAGDISDIQAEMAAEIYEFNAEQARRDAGVVVAISQRHAAEQRRQMRLNASRTLAVAAASGAGASDVTVMNLIADTEAEGQYRANVALYEGEAEARRLQTEAALSGLRGEQALIAGGEQQAGYYLSAGGTLLQGATNLLAPTLYSKYGGGGPAAPIGGSALITSSTGLGGVL